MSSPPARCRRRSRRISPYWCQPAPRHPLDALGKEYDLLLRLPISPADFDPEKGIDWRSWTAGRRRAALKGFIKRIEFHSYPEGMAQTRRRRKNESEQEYLDAKLEIVKFATASRIRIVWKWEME